MNTDDLFAQILKKKSFLCVGLDSDLNKIPQYLRDEFADDEVQFEFNKQIIDATAPYTVCYKPNFAFYEELGAIGWIALEKTIAYIQTNYPDIFIIGDAKRADIGNTAAKYATMAFKTMNLDAVTVAPYMGSDSVSPFLAYTDKFTVILALTSNKGAFDFQYYKDDTEQRLFEGVISKAVTEWGAGVNNSMFVVGATKAEMLTDIRKIVPEYFLLIPGVGAQGGSLQEVAKYGITKQCGLLVNNSRDIIFAGIGYNFAEKAGIKASEMQAEMAQILTEYSII